MTDGIIKGNGASRYLKTIASGLSQYPTYEDFMQALIEGTFPVDLFGRNPGGWTQEGTLLNKSTLLPDGAAMEHGLSETATIADMWRDLVPVGAVFWLAAEIAPAGFLVCDGSTLSKADYSRLFAVIGAKFGDHGDTFNLPDLRAAFVRGAGASGVHSAQFGARREATSFPYVQLTASPRSLPDVLPNDTDGSTTRSFSTRTMAQVTQTGLTSAYFYHIRPYNIALTPIIKY